MYHTKFRSHQSKQRKRKMPNYDFKSDLQVAEQTEQQIADFLYEYGWQTVERNNDYRYDLLAVNEEGVEATFEIKEDFTCRKTGNVGLEFECRGKPSGIATSKADYYIYKLHEPDGRLSLYINSTDEVKKMVKNKRYFKIVCGGDPGSNSMNYLFKLNTFKECFSYLGVLQC